MGWRIRAWKKLEFYFVLWASLNSSCPTVALLPGNPKCMMTCGMVSWGFVYGLLLGNCRYQTERKKELWPKRNRTTFAILATKLITHFALGLTVAASMRIMKVLNIRNITWPCGDIKFLFDCWKIFSECRAQQVKYFSTQEVAMAKQLYVMFY